MSVRQIIDTALRYDVEVQGPIPLPTEIKKYTVNRSAFVYKNAREQFEMRVHKRLIDIINPSAWARIKSATVNENLTETTNLVNKKNLYESIAAAYFNVVSFQKQIIAMKETSCNV